MVGIGGGGHDHLVESQLGLSQGEQFPVNCLQILSLLVEEGGAGEIVRRSTERSVNRQTRDWAQCSNGTNTNRRISGGACGKEKGGGRVSGGEAGSERVRKISVGSREREN